MDILVLSKKSLVQEKSFKRNHTISTGIPNLGVWCKNNLIGHPESEADKKKQQDLLYISSTQFLVQLCKLINLSYDYARLRP